jgi:heptosyltransferase-2
MSDPRNILVRAPNWIGDQVMAFPFYRALRTLYPQARISLLAVPAVAGVPDPIAFAEKIAITPALRRHPWKLGRNLREKKFDLAISLAASASSALTLFAARIPRRLGYGEALARVFLTEPRVWRGRTTGEHKAQLYLDLVAPGLTPQWDPLDLPRERRIVVAPAASIALREWPYFAELLRGLHACYPQHTIVLVGSPADRRFAATLGQLPGVEDRIGTTSLAELTDLLARASLVVANDSGIAHLAATLAGARTLVLFGPGDPQYVRQLGDRAIALRAADVACSPCESARCAAPYGYQKCLRSLGADAVLQAAAAIL